MTAPSHPKVEDCLFHYTSAKGLMGILKDQCVFATDSAFLNDSSEITYAGRAVERHLKNMIDHINLSPPPAGSKERTRLGLMVEAKGALAKFNEAKYDLAGSARSVFDGATYVSCFTEKPDQLSQWRGYGGRGYSVGFTRDGLNKLIIDEEHTPAENVIEVDYGERGLEKLRQEVSTFLLLVRQLAAALSVIPLTLSFRDWLKLNTMHLLKSKNGA